MKTRAAWLGAVLAIGVWLLPVQAACDGFGFYSWTRGWSKVGVPDFLKEQVPYFQDLKVDLCYDHFALGYLYDGASSTDQRFGWRYNLGFDVALVGLQGADAPVTFLGPAVGDAASKLFDAVGFGFTSKLTYGIGLFHTKRLRFWAGPSVALTANYLTYGSVSLEQGTLLYEARPWGVSLSLGGGIETGLRFEATSEVTLDFSTGFLYNFFGFYQDPRVKVNGQPLKMDTDRSFLIGQEPAVFVQMAVRFKMPAN